MSNWKEHRGGLLAWGEWFEAWEYLPPRGEDFSRMGLLGSFVPLRDCHVTWVSGLLCGTPEGSPGASGRQWLGGRRWCGEPGHRPLV